MANRKIKWLIYTVLVGLIPIILRILVWLVSQSKEMILFNASDFVAFGLIMHISNINEIEKFNSNNNSWKTIQNGISVLFIAFYSVLLAANLLGQSNPGIINNEVIKYISISLSFVSFMLSFSIYHRVSKLSEEKIK